VALHPERPQDDAEWEAERLENGALLDVELEVGGSGVELAARVDRLVEVDPVLGERLGKGRAGAVCELPELVLIGHRACGRA
jgi:hypothetical protein